MTRGTNEVPTLTPLSPYTTEQLRAMDGEERVRAYQQAAVEGAYERAKVAMFLASQPEEPGWEAWAVGCVAGALSFFALLGVAAIASALGM